jgi:hypothetical protein
VVGASTVSLPFGSPPLPFEALDSETGAYVKIEKPQDAHSLFNSWSVADRLANERRFLYAQNAEILGYIIEPAFQDVLKRKFFCDKYPSVPPFKGSFDDIPEWWITAVSIIEKAIDDAYKYVRR